eukprot:Awhi_evm1s6153
MVALEVYMMNEYDNEDKTLAEKITNPFCYMSEPEFRMACYNDTTIEKKTSNSNLVAD